MFLLLDDFTCKVTGFSGKNYLKVHFYEVFGIK